MRSPLLQPRIDLEGQLLTVADLFSALAVDGPQETSTSVKTTWASVPSISPAAFEGITLSRANAPGGTAQLVLQEVIGDVGSVALAAELATDLGSAAGSRACDPDVETVPLPGSNPPATAFVSGGLTSAGATRSAVVYATRGAEVLALSWTSSTASNATAGAVPELPALPDADAMGGVLALALSRMPG